LGGYFEAIFEDAFYPNGIMSHTFNRSEFFENRTNNGAERI